uniref:ATP-dependent Clp protease adaptor ClpS n=1 Tax=Ruminococcus sp. TaxID=41978 RepID=UPI00338F9E43|nr:ATP-dependent Clp protease adaptor ClpS [Ruminococcus sp.]
NEQKAVKYMMMANDCGKCSLGVYSYEIAETLMIESMRYVHSEGYHDFRMTVEEA